MQTGLTESPNMCFLIISINIYMKSGFTGEEAAILHHRVSPVAQSAVLLGVTAGVSEMSDPVKESGITVVCIVLSDR